LKRKQRTKDKGQRKRTKEKDKGKGQRKRTKEKDKGQKDKGTWPAKFISGLQIYSPLQEGFRLSPGI
jgi:hypothetical protein